MATVHIANNSNHDCSIGPADGQYPFRQSGTIHKHKAKDFTVDPSLQPGTYYFKVVPGVKGPSDIRNITVPTNASENSILIPA